MQPFLVPASWRLVEQEETALVLACRVREDNPAERVGGQRELAVAQQQAVRARDDGWAAAAQLGQPLGRVCAAI